MKRNVSFFALLIGLLSLLLAPAHMASAWSITPQDVSFTNQQGILIPGKLFKPAGNGPFPAVVMMHGCSGIYSNSNPASGVATINREWGDRLVAAGYVALLVDSYTPRGAPQNQCGASVVSPQSVRPYDAYAAYNYLIGQSYIEDSIGLLGWSAGGSSTLSTMVLTASVQADFKAAVAFYPGCGLENAFGGLSQSTWVPYAPLRILHGTADATVSAASCQTRVNRATLLGAGEATGNPTDIILYEGAHHSFDLAKQVGGNYTIEDVNAKTAADQETMNFFNNYLK